MNIIDTHVDTITTLIDNNQPLYQNTSHISIENLHAFDKKGIYFAIWLSQERRKNPFQETSKAIDFYYNEINKNKDYISHSNTYLEFINTFNSRKTASILSLEGGEALEGNLDNLYYLYEKGVRLLTLTWNNDNELGSGILGSDNGLTAFGNEVVNFANNNNFILDVSHLNQKGFFEIINKTQKPIIASHSNAYSVHPSKRNLTDEQLLALKSINSYVSFTLHSPFINGENNCSENNLLFHIDHLISLLGEDYVSFGSDFDGTLFLPCEFLNISSTLTLYNLVKKTYNTDIANKIFYKNQLNFLKEVI